MTIKIFHLICYIKPHQFCLFLLHSALVFSLECEDYFSFSLFNLHIIQTFSHCIWRYRNPHLHLWPFLGSVHKWTSLNTGPKVLWANHSNHIQGESKRHVTTLYLQSKRTNSVTNKRVDAKWINADNVKFKWLKLIYIRFSIKITTSNIFIQKQHWLFLVLNIFSINIQRYRV